MDKAEIARENFKKGYNCAQAVLMAFAPDIGLPEETALLMAASFGGGMGRLREVCGAVSAMFMVSGMRDGYMDPKDAAAKRDHYARIQKLAAQFKEENGSYICRELLGRPAGADTPIPAPRTGEYYQKRPCAELVYSAAAILERGYGPTPQR